MAQVKLEGVGKVYPGDVTAVTDLIWMLPMENL